MNPFLLLVAKQTMGVDDADDIELRGWIHFDAARRGRCGAHGYNRIAEHLVMAYYLAERLKSPAFKKLASAAGDAWRAAGQRPGDDVGLSTREYQAVRAALAVYFRHLSLVEIGMYREAFDCATAIMQSKP